MLSYFTEASGKPSIIHSCGQQAKGAVAEATLKLAEFIGARCGQIVFTSVGTEVHNCAIKGLIYDRKDNRNTGSAFSLPASFSGY